MAAEISVATSVTTHRFSLKQIQNRKPISNQISYTFFTLQNTIQRKNSPLRRKQSMSIAFVFSQKTEDSSESSKEQRNFSQVTERLERKRLERYTYLVAAIISSLGITSMAIASVYYRFSWQMEEGEIPVLEMLGTLALSVGAAVGMEFWARWAHRVLWHASLWHMHQSHHRQREGPFEVNDVFAIVNAIPAIVLLSFGFFNKGLLPVLCFGAGLGITVFGMAYMFVHDGLVHRRFPVGPIANFPYLRRVAAAHHLHHSARLNGVPYGLFLGPKEIEEVGGSEDLEKEIQTRNKISKNSL